MPLFWPTSFFLKSLLTHATHAKVLTDVTKVTHAKILWTHATHANSLQNSIHATHEHTHPRLSRIHAIRLLVDERFSFNEYI